jgi:MazG family protein
VSTLKRLLEIMRRLRDPEEGCPWDLEQGFESIAPYTIEEAYEVDDAIRRGDMEDLCGELGDLLLQVVFHAQMASEQGLFDFEDVAGGIADKLIRRHPHVFAQPDDRSVASVLGAWEDEKARERAERAGSRAAAAAAGGHGADPLFEGIPEALPALMRAAKLQSRAARERPAPDVRELAAELSLIATQLTERARREDLDAAAGASTSADVGRLLFAIVAVARELRVDPETALRERCVLFERQVQQQRKSSSSD